MKQWLKAIVYTPKYTKPTDENILLLLLPSFVGILICMACLAGTTWAWFSTGVQTQPQTIMAASFDIVVTIDDVPVDISRSLIAGQAYKVTLTASGTAPSGGYCKVAGGNDLRYTPLLIPGDEPFTFTLVPEKTADYTFTAVWGGYPDGTLEDDIIGKEEPSPDLKEDGADVETTPCGTIRRFAVDACEAIR